VDLRLLVLRIGARLPVDFARSTLRRAPRLFDRLGPRAGELHQLRAVDEAGPAERHEIGLRRAPTRQRRGPFAGSVHDVELAAAGDRIAVGEPGQHRPQAARGHADHRLVEQGEPAIDLPLEQQDLSLQQARVRAQIRVVKPVAHGGRLHRRGARAFVLAHCRQPVRLREQQIPLLDAVDVLDQPLGAREPAARLACLAHPRQAEPAPERPVRGTRLIAAVQTELVEPIHEMQKLVIAAEQPRRQGVELEVGPRQRRFLVRGSEATIRLRPGPATVAVAAARDLVRFPGAAHGRSLLPRDGAQLA